MDSRKCLSNDEREILETSLRTRLESDKRNVCMILVTLHAGARASELLALEWGNFNLQTGELFIRTLKQGRDRAVVLPKFLLTPLKELKLAHPLKPFALSYNRLGEIWRMYRTVEKPFHSLRHTFAMRVYDRTKDIRFTMRALGHKNIQNTMVYADYAYSAQEFKKLMKVR